MPRHVSAYGRRLAVEGNDGIGSIGRRSGAGAPRRIALRPWLDRSDGLVALACRTADTHALDWGCVRQPVRNRAPLCQKEHVLANRQNLALHEAHAKPRKTRRWTSSTSRLRVSQNRELPKFGPPLRGTGVPQGSQVAGRRTDLSFVLTFPASSAPVKAKVSVFGGSRRTRRPGAQPISFKRKNSVGDVRWLTHVEKSIRYRRAAWESIPG